MYYRLLAEKKRTAEWASHMRVLNSTNAHATVTPEECNAVVVLLAKLETCYRKAQVMFSAIEDLRKEPVDATTQKAGTKSLLDGYDDLKELMDTLGAMNNALKSIAPPLVTCSPNYRAPSPLRSSSPVPMNSLSLAAAPPPASDSTAQKGDETASMYDPTTLPPVHSIYQTTLDTLIHLSIKRRNPHIARSASRLKLWGASLFNMSIPLDVVFSSDTDAYQPLRTCTLNILVEILVWEGA